MDFYDNRSIKKWYSSGTKVPSQQMHKRQMARSSLHMKHQTAPLTDPKQYVRIWGVNNISECTSLPAYSVFIFSFPFFWKNSV